MPVIIPSKANKARKRKRILRPVKPPRSAQVEYLKVLRQNADILAAQTKNLSDMLKAGADRSDIARTLAQYVADSDARLSALAPDVAKSFVTKVDRIQKEQTERTIASALGVDFAKILDTPGVRADLDFAISANTSLIKSIGSEHWAKVGQAIMDNYSGRALVGNVSLTERLMEIGGITKNRAKFIARDQTAKLSSDLAESRQKSIGVQEYEWRTAEDERVVGTPGGKYPNPTKGHGDHYARNGKIFRWDDPPSDGPPGKAYNCRCVSKPVLDLDKLEAQFV